MFCGAVIGAQWHLSGCLCQHYFFLMQGGVGFWWLGEVGGGLMRLRSCGWDCGADGGHPRGFWLLPGGGGHQATTDKPLNSGMFEGRHVYFPKERKSVLNWGW